MMFIIEFKAYIILTVSHLILQDKSVLLKFDLVQVQSVDLLSEVVSLGFIKLLDFVIVLFKSTSLIHYLFAHVVAVFLMRMFHGYKL